jgi:hypothetical protein
MLPRRLSVSVNGALRALVSEELSQSAAINFGSEGSAQKDFRSREWTVSHTRLASGGIRLAPLHRWVVAKCDRIGERPQKPCSCAVWRDACLGWIRHAGFRARESAIEEIAHSGVPASVRPRQDRTAIYRMSGTAENTRKRVIERLLNLVPKDRIRRGRDHRFEGLLVYPRLSASRTGLKTPGRV